ncbi:hypothetical protein K492DRAFT_238514 [Lichtheimia hyalospora FSU 10163]|nr:hypothetical protein K492DRAFT_238514 [Lichtheimia hyalospora FSU 10163]
MTPSPSKGLVKSSSSHRSLVFHSEEWTARNLSSDYQEIQIRTLTAWVNAQLKEQAIIDMRKDLQDGRQLLRLLATVEDDDDDAPKPEKGRMRIHQLSNVAQALSFLAKRHDDVPDIGNEAIVNGDLKRTLALLFYIMTKYQFQPILDDPSLKHDPATDPLLDHQHIKPSPSSPSMSLHIKQPQQQQHLLSSTLKPSRSSNSIHHTMASSSALTEAKSALLRWVRIQLDDYTPHILGTIQDFSRSWRSGLAFCLLIHCHDPDLIPALFDTYIHTNAALAHELTREQWHDLLSLAFDTAAQEMHVPRYLEPEDLTEVDYPHEPSVMMYITEYYRVMSAAQSNESDDEKALRMAKRRACINQLLQSTQIPTSLSLSQQENNHHDVIIKEDTLEMEDNTTLMEEYKQKIDMIQQDAHISPAKTLQATVALDSLADEIKKHGDDNLNNVVTLTRERLKQLEKEWEDHQNNGGLHEKTLPVQEEMNRIQHMIDKNPYTGMHPLDGTDQDIKAYEQFIAELTSSISTFNTTFWDTMEQHLITMQLKQQHDALLSTLDAQTKRVQWFKRGVSFRNITGAVSEQLDIVQSIMNDSSNNHSVTDDAIQDLEKRVDVARTAIHAIHDEYADDLNNDSRSMEHLKTLETTYRTIRDWVDEVRSWFIEAERIRAWIDEKIAILEQRNEKHKHVDPLGECLSLSDDIIQGLDKEHEQLRTEVERFDADDMARLRSHVKNLTLNRSDADLTPADTSTIEITLTTLNMLNQLMQLLQTRSVFVDMLVLRLKWEHLFADAVKWIAQTDDEMTQFLRRRNHWMDDQQDEQEQENDDSIEHVVKTLVTVERKIADFDQHDYSHVLDAYQEMEDLHQPSSPIPQYLETRQENFEKAFEDLMKRAAYCRKVVEQRLAVMEVVSQYRLIRDQGEQLRKTLSSMGDKYVQEDQERLAEDVDDFKEKSAQLISHFAARVPYPQVDEMATAAIGAGDAQDNQAVNEAIRSAISTYGMALALTAEGLDQLLAARQDTLSLHQRSREAYDKMTRLIAWMNERMRILGRVDLNNPTIQQKLLDDESEVARLEKERETTALRLDQMEHEDLASVLRQVQQLEDDIDRANAVSIDRGSLVSCIEDLERAHRELQNMLTSREQTLNMIKQRAAWQAQWIKTNHHIVTVARKTWDLCIKKARYDPRREDPDKPSYANDSEHAQALQALQDRTTEIEDRHMGLLRTVDEGNPQLVEIETKLGDLRHLLHFTSELMTQRAIVTEFLLRAQDAHREGDKLKDAIAKATRRIQTDDSFQDRADALKSEVKRIWDECVVPWPTYQGGPLLRALQPVESSSNYAAQVKAQVKALLDARMEELYALQTNIDNVMNEYNEMHKTHTLVKEYDAEAEELQQWLDQQAAALRAQHVDVAADEGSFIVSDITQLEQKHAELAQAVDTFEHNQVRELHDKVIGLENIIMTEPARRGLGQVMHTLEQLKLALADHVITMEAAAARLAWQEKLNTGKQQMDALTESLRRFTANKNMWVTQPDFGHEQLQQLDEQWNALMEQKHLLMDTTLPAIETSYETFVSYFSKLVRPMATPDHLEVMMESLHRAITRLEESLGARARELELVRDRVDLADQLQASLAWLHTHRQELETLIEEHIKWKPEGWNEDVDKLQEQKDTMHAEFVKHCEETALGLRKTLDDLCETATSHGTVVVSDSFKKQMQQLDIVQDTIRDHFDFSTALLIQTRAVCEFMLQATELETQADSIRDDLASTHSPSSSGHQSQQQHEDWGMAFMDRLYELKNGIDHMPSISYPTSNDETNNDMIRDWVDTRTKRLYGLHASLEQLLESKEGISRKKIALQAYLKEVETCRSWIAERMNGLVFKTDENDDVIKLRKAIQHVEGVQAAMAAHGNVWETTRNAYAKCTDPEPSIQEQHTSLEKAWKALETTTHECRQSLLAALEPAEIRQGIAQLKAAYDTLQDDITHADTATVSDEQMTQWQKDMDTYETVDYAKLLKSVRSDDDDIRMQLDTVAEQAVAVRAMMTTLYDAVNACRLQRTHAENAMVVQNRLQKVRAFMQQADHMQHIALEYDDCRDAYGDLQAYHAFIGGQVVSDEIKHAIDQVQAKVDDEWALLESAKNDLAALEARTEKWAKRHEALEALATQLEAIQVDQEARNKVQTIISALDELNMSSSDDKEAHMFMQRHKEITKQAEDLMSKIKELEMNLRRVPVLESTKDQVSGMQATINQNVTALKKEQDVLEWSNDIIKRARIHKRTIDAQHTIHAECNEEITTGNLYQQCQQLVNEYGMRQEDVDALLQPLAAALDTWQELIQQEDAFSHLAQMYTEHTQQASAFQDTLATISTAVPIGMDGDEEHEDDDESTLQETMDNIVKLAKDITTACNPTDKRSTCIREALEQCMSDLRKQYDQVKASMDEKRARQAERRRKRESDAKAAELTRHAESLKARVEALEWKDNTITPIEQQEFRELEDQVAQLKEQAKKHPVMSACMEDLEKAMKQRHEQLAAQSNWKELMSMLDQLEEQASLLSTAVDDAAPHHASIVNNKFSKNDLQSLLKVLVGAYKQHEPNMTQLVKRAKAEAGDRTPPERMKQVLMRCNKVRASAAARERELQMCISQLDHEFFTKLAMAKSKPKRRKNPTTPVSMSRRSSSQGSSSNNANRTPNLRPSKTPSRTRYVADPKNELDIELGRIVNENPYRVKVKMVPGEVGKYWFGEVNPRLVYCRILPSKLVMVRVGGGWVELSKFLFDHNLTEGTPRNATTTTEESSSLAAASSSTLSHTSSESSGGSLSSTFQHHPSVSAARCVSPSGRISIRGGGTASASTSEHLLSVTRSSTSSSASRRSKTPRGGYVDGDKYIRVDEAGNQVMVKMTKAEDGAKMPIGKRR